MITEEEFAAICKTVKDPELDIDILTLELIYEHKIEPARVWIKMTFTSPFCPYGPEIVERLEGEFKKSGVEKVEIEITFEPPWQPSDLLKEMLGMG